MDSEKLLKKINDRKARVKKYETNWDQIQPEMVPNVYFSIGLDASWVAIYDLLLNNKDEALEWFKKSAACYEGCIKERRARWGTATWMDEAGNCNDLLNSAILFGEKAGMVRAASVALAIGNDFPDKYRRLANIYYYVKALGHIQVGENEKAAEIVDKVNYLPDPHFKDYFNGLRICLEGIIKGDVCSIVKGLDHLLKYHHEKYGKSNGTAADELVCVPATVHIRLAKMRNLMIKPEDIEDIYRKYIPWNLFE